MRLFGEVKNFFGGGAPLPQPYQTPQNIKDFMQPVSVPEAQAAAHYQDLIGAKQGYDWAQLNIDTANKKLANPDLTDEQRKYYTNAAQGWADKRDFYAQAAEDTRKSAAAIGLDVSDYGTDKSLDEANQAFLKHKSVAVNNFLNNMPTLDELQKNRYFELRSQGASPRQAERIVGRERGEMQSQMARRLGDFMTAYGTNPDGSIDQGIGIAAMTRVLPDPQSVAQLFASGFAMPNKVYDVNQARAQAFDLATLNNAEAMSRLMASNNANLLNSREDRAARRSNLEYTVENQNEQNRLQREHAVQLKELDLVYKQLYGGGSNSNKKSKYMQDIEDLSDTFGVDEEGITNEERAKRRKLAVDTALRQNFPKMYQMDNELLGKYINALEAGKAAGLEGGSLQEYALRQIGVILSDNDKALLEANHLFDNKHGLIEQAIKEGNKETALEKIAETRGLLNDENYQKLFDKEQYRTIQDRLNVYERIANNDPRSYEDAQWLIEQQFIAEKGRKPTRDELLALVSKADRDGTLLIMPKRKKVTTPTWEFNVAPMSAGSMYNSGAAYNNLNAANSAFVPYGQAAWRP